MLQKPDKTKAEGFTIIEVMIVLAVAALILLIVLLAVPALQRNARNTAIKNDASTVASGISTWESDNNGDIPTTVSTSSGKVSISGASGTNTETVRVQGTTSAGNGPAGGPMGGGSSLVDPGVGTINAYFGYKCDGSSNTRSTAIVYDIETSGGTTPQCIDD